MADITNELMYEGLKQIQADTALLNLGQTELKGELQAVRGHLLALQTDVHYICTTLARHDLRLDRIERRLELVEPAGA